MRWQGGPDPETGPKTGPEADSETGPETDPETAPGTDDLQGVLDDLEMQAEGMHLADRAVEVDELSTAQDAEIELVARALASIGRDVRVSLDGPEVRGRLSAVGADWLCVDHPAGGASFVHLRHVVMITGLADGAVPGPARPITARLSLRSVLRRIADEQRSCAMHLSGGGMLQGDLVRVGADFVEVRLAGGRVTVPLTALCAVRDQP